MADLKISQLPALAGSDLLAADQLAVADTSASETKRITVTDLVGNATTLIADATIPGAKILFSAGGVAGTAIADGGVTTAKLAVDSVTAAKLADESTVDLVTTLPAAGAFTGQIALDTDDSKIYVWNGSAWVSVKGAGSVNVVNGSTTGVVNITSTTSGDTCTIAATLDDTTAAAQFLGGPSGAAGAVSYRALAGADLPTPTTSAKGGVIVNGNGLVMSGDTLTINNTVTAETTEHHVVKYDANGLVTEGRTIIGADVPVATSTSVGVVEPGAGLGVDGSGTLSHSNSITSGSAAKVTFDAQGHVSGTAALDATDIPNIDAAKITTGTFATARIADDAITGDKLADKSTTTIAELTPAGGTFIGQAHLNSISGDFLIWDGNVWQPIGISVGEIILAGTYNATTNKMATVTAEGTALSFVVGNALPAASTSNKGYYVVVSVAGTGTSPAPAVSLSPPDFLLSTGTGYTEIDVSSTVTAQQATNIGFSPAGNVAATNVQAAIEELDTEKAVAASPTLTGTVTLGEDAVITFEGATSNAFETTLTVADPTADRTVTLPDATGTLISTGDTGTVTTTMIADGAITNTDINAAAEIAVSKLANGTARQLLQTDSAGTGVEFTSNVDIPGTLDVTGVCTLDEDALIHGLKVGRGGSGVLTNTVLGTTALNDNTSGFSNVAVGYDAMHENTGGDENVAIGRDALYKSTTSNRNIAIGHNTLAGHDGDPNDNSVFTGSGNVAIGNRVMEVATSSGGNVAIGENAGQSLTTGGFNIAIGTDSLKSQQTTYASSVAIGLNALEDLTTGHSNVAIGPGAMKDSVSGKNNTAIGTDSMENLSSGENNIMVGGSKFSSTGGLSFTPVFDVTSEDNRLVLGHTSISNAYVKVAFTVTSDERDKMNFASVPYGLDFVNKLKPTAFQFKIDRDTETPQGDVRYGFKAQDILALEGDNPVIIDAENADHLKYKGEHLVPVLVNAIQELTTMVNELKSELAALKGG